jgi:hypothetical protein
VSSYRVAIVLLCSVICGCKNDRQIFKKISKGDLTVIWYRELFADKTIAFVGSEFKGKEDTLLSCGEPLITDVYFRKDTVVIRVYQMSEHFAYTQKDKDHGYIIKPENATYREWVAHYHPEDIERLDKGLIADPAKDQTN